MNSSATALRRWAGRKLAGGPGKIGVLVDVHYANGKIGKALRYKTVAEIKAQHEPTHDITVKNIVHSPMQKIEWSAHAEFADQELNGVPFTEDSGKLEGFWKDTADKQIDEPPLKAAPGTEKATGCIVVESDGRVWVYEPAGHFGGYQNTFPKGRLESDLTMQQNALKEVYEELGLQVEIVSHFADKVGDVTTTRYYIARRIGGAPWASGPETAAVKLVPMDRLGDLLNKPRDLETLAMLHDAHEDIVHNLRLMPYSGEAAKAPVKKPLDAAGLKALMMAKGHFQPPSLQPLPGFKKAPLKEAAKKLKEEAEAAKAAKAQEEAKKAEEAAKKAAEAAAKKAEEDAKKVPDVIAKVAAPTAQTVETPFVGVRAVQFESLGFTYKSGGQSLGGAGKKDLYTDKNGEVWIYKPAVAKDFVTPKPYAAAAQEMVSKVAGVIRMEPVVPFVMTVNAKGEMGVLQKFVPADGTLSGVPPSKLTDKESKSLAKEHIVDWITSQHDSHSKNLLRAGGKIQGIDKEQAFKYFPNDKLDVDYHPNSQYGEQEPYHNTFWREFAKGNVNFDPKTMGPAIDRAEKITDIEWYHMMKPYAATIHPVKQGMSDHEIQVQATKQAEFIKAANERRKNVRADFEKFITGLYQQREGTKGGKFTFKTGWSG